MKFDTRTIPVPKGRARSVGDPLRFTNLETTTITDL